VVLVIRLLRQDLNRLVEEMEPVELWDEGWLSHVVSYKSCIKCIYILNVLTYQRTDALNVLMYSTTTIGRSYVFKYTVFTIR
jgi:hypothetical protein